MRVGLPVLGSAGQCREYSAPCLGTCSVTFPFGRSPKKPGRARPPAHPSLRLGGGAALLPVAHGTPQHPPDTTRYSPVGRGLCRLSATP
ncbi:hypothetical protein NDU88_006270 [Pleurodeles waltl]|uniref:Uncharacterized protein n=1 Tax=Pleurodeles waltl TaxID=8319 RepID=A0AAV7MCT6_PLEWA|nr:hypothetical protein NDU88_006270 [Pleurodeles waltl]